MRRIVNISKLTERNILTVSGYEKGVRAQRKKAREMNNWPGCRIELLEDHILYDRISITTRVVGTDEIPYDEVEAVYMMSDAIYIKTKDRFLVMNHDTYISGGKASAFAHLRKRCKLAALYEEGEEEQKTER